MYLIVDCKMYVLFIVKYILWPANVVHVWHLVTNSSKFVLHSYDCDSLFFCGYFPLPIVF